MNCKIEELKGDSKSQKWWEGLDGKKGKKWKTLKHNGVYFGEPYVPLPKDAYIKYDGKKVDLSKSEDNRFGVSAEEAALLFAQTIDIDERNKEKKKRQDYYTDPDYRKNFFNDWKEILGKKTVIKDFDKVDFSLILDHIEKKREEKKNLTKEEKLEIKERKEKIKKLYGYAILDGVKMEMDFSVEPPSLYKGHGKQPSRGKIKGRIRPKDVTLNISKGEAPECMLNGETFKYKTVENKDVVWMAYWKHPITNSLTYKWLKRNTSHFAASSDMAKFQKASNLNINIGSVRNNYKKDLDSKNRTQRELATAVYLLDVLAIRPGTEKDETKEAGTLGLTTLRCENIQFMGGNKIKIDFVGKSSIQYVKEFVVDKAVYKNLKENCNQKKKKDDLFPNINSNTLNGYLKTLLPELTAKVFRTWKASQLLQDTLFKKIPPTDASISDKKAIYDEVNTDVALILNHKKLTEGDEQEKKIEAKLKEAQEELQTASTGAKRAALEKKIKGLETKLNIAKENVALGTSKLNYLDPRISIAWAKTCDFPVEKLYNKTQMVKFVWSMEVPPNWRWGTKTEKVVEEDSGTKKGGKGGKGKKKKDEEEDEREDENLYSEE